MLGCRACSPSYGQSKFATRASIIPVVVVVAAVHVEQQGADQFPIVQPFSAGQEHELCDSHAAPSLLTSLSCSFFCSLALSC
ncbi:hypothetical protein C405_05976 [Stenotrophomonas maltophilia AU12-09]|nr:hypothetical protein C405_05976 [Stenotrophomonas maltophilia AU12-09]